MTYEEKRAAERAADLEAQITPDRIEEDDDYFAWLAANTPKAEKKPFYEDDDRYTAEACVKMYNDGHAAGVEWLQYMCSLDGVSVEDLSSNVLQANMRRAAVQRQRCYVCSPDVPGHFGEPFKTDCQDNMHCLFSVGFLCGVMTVLVEEATRR